MIYETFTVTLKAPTLNRLERALALAREEAAREFEDDDIIQELGELENEIRARLQRIAVGDVQR
jgi:hypothetical protein